MDDAIDSLFAMPPSEFVEARNALVKELRAEGRTDAAAEVAKLRRPTVAAWAANQVAREDPGVIDDLATSGEELAAAQRRALSGVKETGMREAAERRRARVEQAWSRAAAVLQAAGIDAAAHRQAVTDTFEAATLDAAAAETVRTGHLSVPLPAPAGFGGVLGLELVADAALGPADDDRSDDDAARRAAAEAAARAAQQASARADDLQHRAGDARQAALRAQAEAQRIAQRAAEAGDRADELTAQAQALESEAQAARAKAQRLAQELR